MCNRPGSAIPASQRACRRRSAEAWAGHSSQAADSDAIVFPSNVGACALPRPLPGPLPAMVRSEHVRAREPWRSPRRAPSRSGAPLRPPARHSGTPGQPARLRCTEGLRLLQRSCHSVGQLALLARLMKGGIGRALIARPVQAKHPTFLAPEASPRHWSIPRIARIARIATASFKRPLRPPQSLQ